jgi:phage shock protein PspC (stress-responsive transcriptional regulator)
MGGSVSRTKQISKIINKQTIDISTSSEFNAHSDIENTSFIDVSGGSTSIGASIDQYAKANITALKSERNNFNFISKLKNKIKTELDSKKSDLGIANKDISAIGSLVDNSIETNYSSEKLDILDSKIKNTTGISVRGASFAIASSINQRGESFMEFVDNASTDLATKIVAITDSENKTKKVTTNPISDVVDSVGGVVEKAFKGASDLFGIDSDTMAIIAIVIIILAIIGGVVAYIQYGKNTSPTAPLKMSNLVKLATPIVPMALNFTKKVEPLINNLSSY